MATLEDKALWENQEQEDDDVGQDILRLAPEEITNRTRLLENDIKVIETAMILITITTNDNDIGHEIRDRQTSTRTSCNEGKN